MRDIIFVLGWRGNDKEKAIHCLILCSCYSQLADIYKKVRLGWILGNNFWLLDSETWNRLARYSWKFSWRKFEQASQTSAVWRYLETGASSSGAGLVWCSAPQHSVLAPLSWGKGRQTCMQHSRETFLWNSRSVSDPQYARHISGWELRHGWGMMSVCLALQS